MAHSDSRSLRKGISMSQLFAGLKGCVRLSQVVSHSLGGTMQSVFVVFAALAVFSALSMASPDMGADLSRVEDSVNKILDDATWKSASTKLPADLKSRVEDINDDNSQMTNYFRLVKITKVQVAKPKELTATKVFAKFQELDCDTSVVKKEDEHKCKPLSYMEPMKCEITLVSFTDGKFQGRLMSDFVIPKCSYNLSKEKLPMN